MGALNTAFRNKLLLALPEHELVAVAQNLEPIDMPRRFVLAQAGQSIDYVYFFEAGICSIVVKSPEGQQVEAGIFGRESFGPVAVASGVSTNGLDTFVQVAGEGYRMPVAEFNSLMAVSPELNRIVQILTYLQGLQVTYTALSNAVHQVDERLARWLLMCHDRTSGNEIALTHEFVAMMLAVRRPSVTTALHTLEGAKFIRAERGHITIRDRQGLEDFAADAYGVPEAEYSRLLGFSL